MKLIQIFLSLFIIKECLSLSALAAKNKALEKVSAYIVKIMLNDENAQKGRVELAVSDYFDLKFEQPTTQIMKSSDKIVVESYGRNMRKFYKKDFVMMLLPAYQSGSEREKSLVGYIKTQFVLDFPDRSTKFFIVINGENKETSGNDQKCCVELASQMKTVKYFNTLFITLYEDAFRIFEVKLVSGEYIAVPLRKYKFPMAKIGEVRNLKLKLLQYNSAPFSYIENGKLFGIEGNSLNEFCRKYGLDYEIVNKNSTSYVPKEITKTFDELNVDMSFNTGLNLKVSADSIHLFELDGLCFLVPKNIPVSEQEYFSYPFDLPTTVLLIISTIMTTLLWKAMSIYAKSDLKISFIIFEMFKVFIGIGCSGFEKMCRKEKLLIFCYVVVSMIIVSLYQSIMIAFMLTEPLLRSVRDFKELNESKTLIYQYFDDAMEVTFRDELVMNKIKIGQNFSLHVPEKFNTKIVYLTACSYADSFVKAKRNFKGKRQFLEKMPKPLMIYAQKYSIASEFPLKRELKIYVDGLRESGIRNYWISELIRVDLDTQLRLKERNFNIDDRSLLDLKNMTFPFLVLLGGCVIGTLSFFMEQLIRRVWEERIIYFRKRANRNFLMKNILVEKFIAKFLRKEQK
jgi:hypothetical protein